eukprot:TRINITY_DN7246_c0_g1_i1.p1 TRINITY_DN7246_c0_g1~~TRINITY_DN7246_c0_g1_i1.p1  ORF type:complete len:195 (+),score=27.64 TRINITY_DN7246_c0_g1_i1:365-949(+)
MSMDLDLEQCWQELKTSDSLAWCSFRMDSDRHCFVLDQRGARTGHSESDHAALGAALPHDRCRYALLAEPRLDEKRMSLVVWAPDDATIKDRMLTASYTVNLKMRLSGVFEQFLEVRCINREECDEFLERLHCREWSVSSHAKCAPHVRESVMAVMCAWWRRRGEDGEGLGVLPVEVVVHMLEMMQHPLLSEDA